jgi:hypothetical protein
MRWPRSTASSPAELPGALVPPLLLALRDPERTLALTPAGWDRLVPEARAAGLLGHLGVRLDEQKLLACLPEYVQDHVRAAMTLAAECHRGIRWELDRVRRALRDLDVPLVLLKGAAYVLAELPPARGRVFSDVDVMVPKAALPAVEATLLRAGWEPVKLDPYDQRYYRTWMHELPPLRHHRRRTVIDVHHTILPESGRLRPDPADLLQAARPAGDGAFRVLAPTDMVLHSAAHLFQDGTLGMGLRDLTDLDALLRHFGETPGFWSALVRRAERLHLGRPLFYAVRYCSRMLGTRVSPAGDPALSGFRPPWPGTAVMDGLVSRALRPHAPAPAPVGTRLARRLLYLRSHWLRMPPHLLAAHLARKAGRRAARTRA